MRQIAKLSRQAEIAISAGQRKEAARGKVIRERARLSDARGLTCGVSAGRHVAGDTVQREPQLVVLEHHVERFERQQFVQAGQSGYVGRVICTYHVSSCHFYFFYTHTKNRSFYLPTGVPVNAAASSKLTRSMSDTSGGAPLYKKRASRRKHDSNTLPTQPPRFEMRNASSPPQPSQFGRQARSMSSPAAPAVSPGPSGPGMFEFVFGRC